MVAVGLQAVTDELGVVTPFRAPSRRAAIIAERIWPSADRLSGREHVRELGHRQSALALLSTRRHGELARRYAERIFPTDETLTRQFPQGEGLYLRRLLTWRRTQRAAMTPPPTRPTQPGPARQSSSHKPSSHEQQPSHKQQPAGQQPAEQPAQPGQSDGEWVQRSPDFAWLRVGQGRQRVVLWNHRTGASASLNDMGATIWNRVTAPVSVPSLLEQLDALLDTPMDDEQKATVRDFIGGLLAQGVLESAPVN